MPKTNNPIVIVIAGPTASGKTDLARRLAKEYNGELISADSRQVYRFLDVGTGKEGVLRSNTTGSSLASKYPELRYIEDTPQWLTDFVDPRQKLYTVADYQSAAYEVINDVISRGKLPIIVGGTGLYISAITEGYDFSVQLERHTDNPRHSAGTIRQKTPPEWNLLELALDIPRPELHRRIDNRLERRFDEGLIEEAQHLCRKCLTTERMRSFGLEYRYLADFIDGIIDKVTLKQTLPFAIHRYARRQIAWFKRHGQVQWCDTHDILLATAKTFLDKAS